MRKSVLLLSLLVVSLPLFAQQHTASPGFAEGKWLGANESFDIRLGGEDVPQVAVLVDTLDVTSLFDRRVPGTVRYRGEGPPLPKGEHTLTVYTIDDAGSWTQIGQFPIRILSKSGFQRMSFTPTADLTGKGQVGEGHSPDTNAPARDEFQDATTQLALRTEFVRPAFTIRAEGQVSGVTYQNEALRFGSEGEGAPKVDLSGYRIDLERGSTLLSIGHVGYGTFRHLANGLQSRGVSLTFGQGRNISLQLAALNGSSIVGWSNPLGLKEKDHQLLGATLGVETIPSSPGLLRVEYGLFQGSLQPFTGFNQGGVVASEKSLGGTVRILTADPGGRWRFDGGYTSSQFETAFDEEVEGGLTVTPIKTKRSDAYYFDASLGLLRGKMIGSQPANLTLNLRHEDVEPLYRSVGAPIQADIRSDGGDLQFSLGAASGMISHARSQDNLSGLDTVLTSLTRRWSMNLSLPVGSMLAPSGSPPLWAPMLSLQAGAVHQLGDGIPSGGGFTIENIPDQASLELSLSAEWQLGNWRVGGRLGANEQDNRQVGNENADSETSNYALTLGWAPTPKVSLGAEAGLDATENILAGNTDNTFRWLGSLNWAFWREATIGASVTNNHAWDDLDTREQENIDAFVELSTAFKVPSLSEAGGRGRIFIRWTDQRAQMTDNTFGLSDDRESSTLTTGLTLNVF